MRALLTILLFLVCLSCFGCPLSEMPDSTTVDYPVPTKEIILLLSIILAIFKQEREMYDGDDIDLLMEDDLDTEAQKLYQKGVNEALVEEVAQQNRETTKFINNDYN